MSSAKKRRELNRAQEEHDKAKLSAQIAIGNHSMLNLCESVAAQQITELTRQRDLAVEALEAMAQDGWLLCGPEGLSDAQKKACEAISTIKESEANS